MCSGLLDRYLIIECSMSVKDVDDCAGQVCPVATNFNELNEHMHAWKAKPVGVIEV